MSLSSIHLSVSDSKPIKPVSGLHSITVELDANLPIKVTDKRGRGLPGVHIFVTNPTGTSDEAVTDSNGNALLSATADNPNPIVVTKNKIFKTVNYTGTGLLTIILDPVWDE